jgi:tetratricopeptide (TPR) repeat protein
VRTGRSGAAIHLRRFKELSSRRGDDVGEADFELIQGLLDVLTRSFDSAQRRFESALVSAFERDDVYGQLAAMNNLCDLWLSRQPPAGAQLSVDAAEQFERNRLHRAAEWQELVVQMLSEIGDVIAEVPAASKLALTYERLDDWKRALRAHQRTLAAAQKTGSARNEATAWMLLGQCFQRQQRWQEALEAITRCLALVPDEGKPAVRMALAEIYRGMSSPREALGQYQAAYEALVGGSDLVSQFRCLHAIAELHTDLGQRRMGIEKLTEALDIAHVLRLPEEQEVRAKLERWKREQP